ncbi:unnamed protein product [Cuscuta campestris]|uniref:SWIM-type domain-containing protein n=1 Tax=Cuscuta campestris TaxID=132261 RepID=A0A484N4B2_9ASTE|nr:unnamed protein product [Cuscuta campestris]
MVFKSLEDGFNFYKQYASLTGFDIRKSTNLKVSGIVVWRYVVCNREGHKHFAPIVNKPTHDDGVPKAKQRRRISNRDDCKACVAFWLVGGVGYTISSFIETHNHPMLSIPSRPFLKINRNLEIGHKKFMLNCAKANIGPMKSYRLFKESVGGYDNVGATAIDFKNFKRDLKAYIAGADAQMLIDKLFRKKQTCSAFHFDYDVDESDQLTRVFWCDPIARKKYAMFGDVISFDVTFNTNRYKMVFTPFTGVDNHRRCVTFVAGLLRREDVPSYTWLFNRFLDAMGHAPQCIITDQDAYMAIAIPEVFPKTIHRLCMWHITNKITAKVDNELAKDQVFLRRLNSVIWNHYLEPKEWEKQWHEVLVDYELESNSWFCNLFAIRTSWIPVYFRDLFMIGLLRTTSRSESENSFFGDFKNNYFTLVEFYMQFESAMDSQRHKTADLDSDSEACIPVYKTPLAIEKHASFFYTLTIFYEVQPEICASCFSCSVLQVDKKEHTLSYVVQDSRGMDFNVEHSTLDDSFSCTCKYWQRIGLLCRHIFLLFKVLKIKMIPERYITNRWCKSPLLKPMIEVSGLDFASESSIDENKLMLNRLWSNIHSCVALIENNSDLLSSFSKVISEQKELIESSIASHDVDTGVPNIFENYCGVPAPSEIKVLPPQPAHNKGSGKRIKSAKEIQIEQSKKNKRMCRTCKELGYHDSRNCPMNYSS